MDTTQGTLLAGRVRYAQPRDGYRTGIEPVLLAAFVPARAGEVVLEAGTGAGAGLLCLAARVPGSGGIGVELDPATAELARRNAAANGFGGLSVLTGNVETLALPPVDHAMANPPWHSSASTSSPVGRRRLAKQESGRGVEAWVEAMARALREGGSLTLIVPPALVERSVAALAGAGLGRTVQLALRPKVERAAMLVLLQARHGAGGAGRNGSVVLHAADGTYTPVIEAVLRGGAGLPPDGTEEVPPVRVW